MKKRLNLDNTSFEELMEEMADDQESSIASLLTTEELRTLRDPKSIQSQAIMALLKYKVH
ncbi:MAG: hypothetical protein K0R73_1240 [Candidatus Midichloriaceae bacterium]|jgi:hypothetical protein|nr:hypothetical protein [Candidatus Midichloriaceae bacterium]